MRLKGKVCHEITRCWKDVNETTVICLSLCICAVCEKYTDYGKLLINEKGPLYSVFLFGLVLKHSEP